LTPVYRAPMRARDREVLGADHGLARGIVGIGDVLASPPSSLDEAVDAAAREHGPKAGRMLRAFAELPDGTFVWTRAEDGSYRLGRIAGPWRYEESPVGIVHVRPATWLDRPIGEDLAPPAVVQTFARGGRNLQRIRDERAERLTAQLWG